MREKLETLPLAELKELAKAQGIKGIKSMRKADLIDRLCEVAQNGGGTPGGAGMDQGGAPGEAGADKGGAPGEAGADKSGAPGEAGADKGGAPGEAGADKGGAPGEAGADKSGAPGEARALKSGASGGAGAPKDRAADKNGAVEKGEEAHISSRKTSVGTKRAAAVKEGTAEKRASAVKEGSAVHQPGSAQSAAQTGSAQMAGTGTTGAAGHTYSTGNRQRTSYRQPDSRMDGRNQDSRNSDNRVDNSRTIDNRAADGRSSDYRAMDNRNSDNRAADNRNSDNRAADNRNSDNRAADNRNSDNRAADNRNSDNRTADSRATDSRGNDGRVNDGYRQEQRADLRAESQISSDLQELDSGVEANGILEVMPDGFGFIRCENYLPGENDVYVAPSQIRRFNMKTGDIILGSRRVKTATEKFAALLYIKSINGYPVSVVERRPNFEDLTPIFPNQRLHMETPRERTSTAMRVLDLLSPIGKGQRGMIVSPPKAGKTTLLKQVAKAVTVNHPDMHLIILLIDERPEEVTDIKESIVGDHVEVIYSTFDELPERHKRVSEMVIERAKRLVEHGRDVIILLDSITRLARAYNLTVAPSGRTLSGGLDPAALHMPKRFFGAARNMREGGSLTVLATALVETGSRMDDVIYEEFKGTGNMELVLDRKLSEKRIFPAIDILKSGTRRDDLLLSREESEAVEIIRKATNTLKPEDAVEKILDLFARTRTNREFVEMSKKIRF